MKYNFSTMINRQKTNALKWDVKDNELPMWVADMDFQTAPEIREAIHQRVEHGVFGYNTVSDAYFNSIINWWDNRHHFQMKREWMMFCTGVVPAISSIVRKMTTVGENILIQSPVYNIFYNSILNNGRNVLSSDLIYNGKEYSIDFNDLENKLSLNQTTMMILCNPHNPIGKIWDKETLKKIGELCKKHNVIVISDEIHCDLTAPNLEYTPFASVSKECCMNSITCVAPTKSFNLAGLQTACIIVPNEQIRHKVNRGINTDEVAEANSFAEVATIAAFTKGVNWLNELKEYIQYNKETVIRFLDENIPSLYVVPSEATYLLWIDCSRITKNTSEFTKFIREKTGLYVSAGEEYGRNGMVFIRINIACPIERVMDGLNRLKNGVEAFK
ncbi:MAG: MalY/PatB family protein [Coprobacillaceae bacterium]